MGAPQTIDQHDFFGQNVRSFAEVSAPRHLDPHDPDGPGLAARASVGAAVTAALGTDSRTRPGGVVQHAGPVHLNVGLRLPLVPERPTSMDPAGEPHRRSRRGRRGPRLAPSHAPPSVGRLRHPGPGRGAWRRSSPGGPAGRRPAHVIPARSPPVVGRDRVRVRAGQSWRSRPPTCTGCPTPSRTPPWCWAALTSSLHTNRTSWSASGSSGCPARPWSSCGERGEHVAVELAQVGREVCDPVRTAHRVLTSIPLAPPDPVIDPDWLADWQAAGRQAGQAVAAALESRLQRGASGCRRSGRARRSTGCCSWPRPGRCVSSRRSQDPEQACGSWAIGVPTASTG